MFGRLLDGHFDRAEEALVAARRGGYPHSDHCDLVASAAAIALERGAPRMMSDSHDTKADRYLDRGTLPWGKLHCGVARFLEQGISGSPGEGVRLVVGDVAQQISAMKVVAAAGNSSFESGLNDAQLSLMRTARSDASFRREMSWIKSGDYHELSPDMSKAVREALSMPLASDLEAEVVKSSAAVERLAARSADVEMTDRFVRTLPGEEHLAAVVAFHSEGRSTGTPEVDGALTLLARRGDGMDFGEMEPPNHMAQARMVAAASLSERLPPSEMAARTITDARVILAGIEEMLSSARPSAHTEAVAAGRYADLDEQGLKGITMMIGRSSLTPAIDRVSMELAAQELPSKQLGEEVTRKGPDPAAFLAMQQQMGR